MGRGDHHAPGVIGPQAAKRAQSESGTQGVVGDAARAAGSRVGNAQVIEAQGPGRVAETGRRRSLYATQTVTGAGRQTGRRDVDICRKGREAHQRRLPTSGKSSRLSRPAWARGNRLRHKHPGAEGRQRQCRKKLQTSATRRVGRLRGAGTWPRVRQPQETGAQPGGRRGTDLAKKQRDQRGGRAGQTAGGARAAEQSPRAAGDRKADAGRDQQRCRV